MAAARRALRPMALMINPEPEPVQEKQKVFEENKYFCKRCEIYLMQSELKNYDCPHCMGQRLEIVT